MINAISHETPFLIVADDDDGIYTERYINLLRVNDIEIRDSMITFYLQDSVIEYVASPNMLLKFRAEIANTLN